MLSTARIVVIQRIDEMCYYLKLGASSQQDFKRLQVVLVRKYLNYAIHQIVLGKLIFTIDNLPKVIERKIQLFYTSSQNQNEWGINRSNLLQDSGKHSFSVHIKVNTFNLTEDMQVLPNLMKHEKLEVQTVVSAYLHTSMANVEKYKLIPGHWSYKIAKLAPFLFSSLLLPSRSLQTRKADCYPQLKISKEYEWLTTTIIPAWPEIMPSWLILFNLDGMQAPQHHTCLSICFCCFFSENAMQVHAWKWTRSRNLNEPDDASAPIVCSSLWSSGGRTPRRPWQCQHPCRSYGKLTQIRFTPYPVN